MADAFHATLEALNPERGHFRAYQIDAGIDLLGDWLITVRFGRIGSHGHIIRYSADSQETAKQLITRLMRRRATGLQRFGTPYRITSWESLGCWIDFEPPRLIR